MEAVKAYYQEQEEEQSDLDYSLHLYEEWYKTEGRYLVGPSKAVLRLRILQKKRRSRSYGKVLQRGRV